MIDVVVDKIKTPVIYKITNIINNKIYIGGTINFYKRIYSHINRLRRNKHYNLKLQNSWNKYGESNFKFEILEHTTKSSVLILEQYYIDIYMPYLDNVGYNLDKIVRNYGFDVKKPNVKIPWNKGKKLPPSWNKGKKLSDEHKKKLSESAKIRKRAPLSEETKLKISLKQKGNLGNNYGKPTNRKKVYQFDLQGNFIKEYDFLFQVSEYNFNPQKVSLVALGKAKTHKNYIWSYTRNNNG